MNTIKDIYYTPQNLKEQTLDLFLPSCNEFPVFIYFHGGGLETGDKSDCLDMNKLTNKGIAVASVNYRMYPYAKYPDFITDCTASVQWIKNNISNYGKPTNIFIGGSSAGAYIAMMMYFDKKYLNMFGMERNDFDGFVFDAGQPATHFNVLRERGIDTRKVIIDSAAPIYHISDYNNDPPMLILCAETDMPGRFQQTMVMIDTLKQMGFPEEKIIFKYMEAYSHCEYIAYDIFFDIICDFFEKHGK